MSVSEEVEILESETGVGGLLKRQRKTIERNVLNNRGSKWFRDQLGVTTLISGVGLLAGVSIEFWLGLNLISLPVTFYHAKTEYKPLKKKFKEDE